MNDETIRILIGASEDEDREEIARRVAAGGATREICFCERRKDLEFLAMELAPRIIVLGEDFVSPESALDEAARRLAVLAPLVVIVRPERQSELAVLAAAHDVEIVARAGNFAALVAARVERCLRTAPRREMVFRSAWWDDLPADFPEILRHEINNPLTGILGNAELLIGQLRGKAPAISLQRLETIVNLAVRLRETIRLLSAEWERQHSSVNSL